MLDAFLVALEDKADALIPYAFSAAKTLNARSTAAYPRRDLAGFEDGSLEARLEAAGGGGAARKAKARDMPGDVRRRGEGRGVDAETLFPDAGEDPPRDVLPRFARAFDFAMVQQREPGRAPARDDLTAALLSESGRPVWVVPAIQRDPAQFKRVLVAWDGGAAPARAFSEARSIIARAEHVEYRHRHRRLTPTAPSFRAASGWRRGLRRRASPPSTGACRAKRTPRKRCCPTPPTSAPT